MPELDEWESFYLIVGGAAGALIGLQLVAADSVCGARVIGFCRAFPPA